MSWLFSQALVEEYWPDTCLDGKPCAQWNVMPTQQGFWRNDKMMEPLSLSLFGQTLHLLKAGPGEAVLMSFLEAFPVKISVLPEKAKESQGSDQDYGVKCGALLAKYDPSSSSLKTAQLSLIEDYAGSLLTLSSSGMTINGCVYQVPSVDLTTSEPEHGWLPTPMASEGPKFYRTSKGAAERKHLVGHGQEQLIHRAIKNVKAEDSEVFQANPQFYEEIMNWPLGWTELKPLEMVRMQEWLDRQSYLLPGPKL